MSVLSRLVLHNLMPCSVASPLAAAKVIKQVLDVLASRASLHALVCVGEPMEMDSLAM